MTSQNQEEEKNPSGFFDMRLGIRSIKRLRGVIITDGD